MTGALQRAPSFTTPFTGAPKPQTLNPVLPVKASWRSCGRHERRFERSSAPTAGRGRLQPPESLVTLGLSGFHGCGILTDEHSAAEYS